MKIIGRLLALAVILLVLLIIPIWAWAGQGVGSNPYTADLLVSGLNTGRLGPGQEYWYTYSHLDLGGPAYNLVLLTLNFKAEERTVLSRVNFQVFNSEQVKAWLEDNSGPLENLGLGTLLSADFDINTGERIWSGPIAANQVYYVRIFNPSPSPVNFRLTALGQKMDQFEAFRALGNSLGREEVDQIVTVINMLTKMTTVTESTTATATATSLPALSPSALAHPKSPEPDLPVSTHWLLAAQAVKNLPPDEAAAWLASAAELGWLPLPEASPTLTPANSVVVEKAFMNEDDPAEESGNASPQSSHKTD